MANLKYKDNNGNWQILNTVRGPKGDNADITLNGQTHINASFYAPEQSGTAGQFLTSYGSGNSPVWVNLSRIASTGNYDDLNGKPTIPTTTNDIISGSTAALTSGGAFTALAQRGIPSGGSAGQVLIKSSGTNYDCAWGTLPLNYLPLSGGTLTGNLTVNGTITVGSGILKKYTWTKNLTIGSDWTDVGITGTDLPTGVYIVKITGVYSGSSTWQATETWGGIMGWYDGETNSEDADEVHLHASGHAKNGQYLTMRVRCQFRSTGRNKIQLKYSSGTPNIPVELTFIRIA